MKKTRRIVSALVWWGILASGCCRLAFGAGQNAVGGGANGGSAQTTATVLGAPATVALSPIAPVTLPPQGGSFSNQAGGINAGIPGVLPASSFGGVVDSTAGGLTPNGAHAESSSTVNSANILNGLITASQIVSKSSSDGNGNAANSSGAGSFASQLIIAGVLSRQTVFPPNTTIPINATVSATINGVSVNIPVTGTVVVNEQISNGDEITTSSLTVNFLHVMVSGSGTGQMSFSHEEIVAFSSSSVQFTRTPNQPPVISAPGPLTAQVGSSLNFVVSASDPDSGDTVTLTVSHLPPGASLSPNAATGNPVNAQFAFAPSEDEAGQTFTVVFSATDHLGASTTAAVPISVSTGSIVTTSHPPIISRPGPQVVGVGETLRFVVIAIDASGSPVPVTASSLPSNASFDKGIGTFAFTPTADQVGQTFVVTFSATDSGGASSTASVPITVVFSTNGGRPGPPVISLLAGPIIVPAGGRLVFPVVAGSPIDRCSLTLSVSGLPLHASFDSNSHLFIFTPSADQVGTSFEVIFTATDCVNQSTSAAVTIVVVSPNGSSPGHLCVPVEKIVFASTDSSGGCPAITLPLHNLGGGQLTLNSIRLAEGSHFQITTGAGFPLVLPSAGSISLEIFFTGKEPGIFQDTLLISTNDPSQPTVSIAITGQRPLSRKE